MSRFSFLSTELEPERVLLVGVDFRNGAWPVDRSLDELERLAHTAGALTVGRVVQRLVSPFRNLLLDLVRSKRSVGLSLLLMSIRLSSMMI